MVHRLIVPVDFSPTSERALLHAVAFSRRANIPVDLLSIASPHDLSATSSHLGRFAAENEIESWAVIESDRPSGSELAKELGADRDAIWIVGSHARTPVGEIVFGSVSEELTRQIEHPIVVVGPHATAPRDGDVLAVALDGSPEAESVIPAACAHARALGLRLRLVQVLTEPTAGDVNETAYLARVARGVDEPGCRDYDVLHGLEVTKAIVDHVTLDEDVVMVAMATHGVPSGAPRLIAGSTTLDVARHVAVPVLVFHPAPPIVVSPRIVVGLDCMAESGAAVEWAADEAQRRSLPLTIVHTWLSPATGAPDGAPIGLGVDLAQLAAEELDRAVAAVRAKHPGLAVEGVVAQDSPANQLVERSEGADLLVVGSRHRGRLAQVLGLSVSSSCAQRASCPVVVVPSPPT